MVFLAGPIVPGIHAISSQITCFFASTRFLVNTRYPRARKGISVDAHGILVKPTRLWGSRISAGPHDWPGAILRKFTAVHGFPAGAHVIGPRPVAHVTFLVGPVISVLGGAHDFLAATRPVAPTIFPVGLT